jgi:hypothetical protein
VPIQQLDLTSPLRLAKPVTTADEDKRSRLTLGALTQNLERGAVDIEQMKQELADTRLKSQRAIQVNQILAQGGDPETTHRALMAIDPAQAEAYRAKVNAESKTLAPDVQQTPEFTSDVQVQGAAIPDQLDGTMGTTPAPQTIGTRAVGLPSKPQPYLTMGGQTQQLPTKSAAQVLQERFAELQKKTDIDTAGKIAEGAPALAANERNRATVAEQNRLNQERADADRRADNARNDLALKQSADEKQKDREAAMERAKISAARVSAGSTQPNDIEDTAQGITEGMISPKISQSVSLRDRTAVSAALKRLGYDQAGAERDWNAVNKHLSTLNGTQQERLRQAITFVDETLPQVEAAYQEWKKQAGISGFKVLNRATQKTMEQLPGAAGSAAHQLNALIGDFTSELGTVYKGGNSSTDESLKLAATNLKGDWNEQTFGDAIKRLKQSVKIRKNSILTSETAGIPESIYEPKAGSPAPSQGWKIISVK